MTELVVDASAMVDLLLGNELGVAVGSRITGHALSAPSHLDAEVLSALGRLHRPGDLDEDEARTALAALASAPITRHPVSELLLGAWARRHRVRLADALYIELASTLGAPLVTTDRRLGDVPFADVVGG